MISGFFVAGASIKVQGERADDNLAFFEHVLRGRSYRRKSKVVFTKSTRMREVKEKNGTRFIAIDDGNGVASYGGIVDLQAQVGAIDLNRLRGTGHE